MVLSFHWQSRTGWRWLAMLAGLGLVVACSSTPRYGAYGERADREIKYSAGMTLNQQIFAEMKKTQQALVVRIPREEMPQVRRVAAKWITLVQDTKGRVTDPDAVIRRYNLSAATAESGGVRDLANKVFDKIESVFQPEETRKMTAIAQMVHLRFREKGDEIRIFFVKRSVSR